MFQYFQRGFVRKVAKLGVLLTLSAFPLHVPGQSIPRKRPATNPATTRSGTQSTNPGSQDPGTPLPGWVLKFQEEFDGSALNFAKWIPHPPANGIPTDAQEWRPDAITVSGGLAHLTTRKTLTGFTSGILTTFGTFARTYGRFDIRFRMPAGPGLEAQFRLLPVPAGEIPSIDILAAVGSDPASARFTNRWGGASAEREYSGTHHVPDLSAGFHISTVEWDEEKIVWFVDGIECLSSFDGVPHQPMYLAVSLTAGGHTAGEPNAKTNFPAVLDIDYIRVFARP